MKYKEFFEELFRLYEKYDISIGHEDSQGAFTLEKNCEFNRNWISDAHILTSSDVMDEDYEYGEKE